ncbi:hypothetical protein TRVL_04714 [Trypanosoma vivax]|nr:hypothetical protein TRVL_04714 [Trypanosoma vivax]
MGRGRRDRDVDMREDRRRWEGRGKESRPQAPGVGARHQGRQPTHPANGKGGLSSEQGVTGQDEEAKKTKGERQGTKERRFARKSTVASRWHRTTGSNEHWAAVRGALRSEFGTDFEGEKIFGCKCCGFCVCRPRRPTDRGRGVGIGGVLKEEGLGRKKEKTTQGRKAGQLSSYVRWAFSG